MTLQKRVIEKWLLRVWSGLLNPLLQYYSTNWTVYVLEKKYNQTALKALVDKKGKNDLALLLKGFITSWLHCYNTHFVALMKKC